MKSTLALCSLVLTITSSFAGSLTTVADPTHVIQGVTVAKSATATTAEGKFSLAAVNAGIRTKKVVFINANIYVAQIFVDQPAAFVHAVAGADMKSDVSSLSSLAAQNVVALKLDFVRDLDAATIIDSFDTALQANGMVAANDTGLTQMLQAIDKGGDMIKGDSITIVGVNGPTNDKLYVENSKGTSVVVTSDNKLVDKMFAIWLGVPADDGLATLKKTLTK